MKVKVGGRLQSFQPIACKMIIPVKINFPLGFIEIKKNLEEIVMTGPVSDTEKITVKI